MAWISLFATAQVQERLRDAELPEGITPELGPLAQPIGEIYRYNSDRRRGRPDAASHAARLGHPYRASCAYRMWLTSSRMAVAT
jgi:Cu/Ag efflux pump CusA